MVERPKKFAYSIYTVMFANSDFWDEGPRSADLPLRRARRQPDRNMQVVDERCASRCAELMGALERCEQEAPTTSSCTTEFARWRSFCVTNSACNPSGRQHDPLRAERKCASLSKRVKICERSVTGQAGESSTTDCEEHRRRYNKLCNDVAMHAMPEPDPIARSQAITATYRRVASAAAAGGADATDTHRGGALVRWAAERLARCDRETTGMRVASAICDHPAAAIAAIAGALSGLIIRREASSNSSLTGAQRLQAGRVYVQGIIVVTTVVVIGLGEAIDLSRRLPAVAASENVYESGKQAPAAGG